MEIGTKMVATGWTTRPRPKL